MWEPGRPKHRQGPRWLGAIPSCLSWVSRHSEAVNQVQGPSRESGQEQPKVRPEREPEKDMLPAYVQQELKVN